MTTFTEGQLTFTFDTGCDVGKYDEWSFYRNNFQSAAGGSKAVDFVCISRSIAWLIEIKDYRTHPRTQPSEPSDEVATKVRDTLAGLAAAAANANDASEKMTAQRALSSQRQWRVVLHLEQRKGYSRLRPKPTDPAALVQKLRQKLRFVDAHATVVDTRRSCADMSWTSAG